MFEYECFVDGSGCSDSFIASSECCGPTATDAEVVEATVAGSVKAGDWIRIKISSKSLVPFRGIAGVETVVVALAPAAAAAAAEVADDAVGFRRRWCFF